MWTGLSSWWRRGCQRRRPERRLWLEQLEDRTVLSTFDVGGGQASFLATAGADNNLTLAVQGINLVLTDTAEPIFLTDAARKAGGSGDGTNTVLCPAAGINVIDLDTVDGSDTVTVRPLGLAATVQIHNAGGLTALTVDDSNDSGPQALTLNSSSLTGLGAATVNYVPGQLTSLTVDVGSGDNRFTVVDTAAGFPTTLTTGTGANTVEVQGTTGPLAINGQGGNDRVTVGNPVARTGGRTLAAIKGTVTVGNLGSFTDLTVDGSGDTSSTHGLFNNDGVNGQISGTDPTPLGQLQGLGDPAVPFLPLLAAINYQDGGLRSLTIDGGSGGNTFTVAGTGSVFTTTLNSGTEADIVMVQATTGPLALDGQDGRDLVILGQWQPFPSSLPPFGTPGSTLNAIQGPVSIRNPRSLTDLSLDDGGDTNANTFLLGAGRIDSSLAARVTYTAAELNSLALRGGAGTTFTVNDPSIGPPTTLTTGFFNVVNVLQAGGPVKVVDADASAQVTAANAVHFEHDIGRGTLQPNVAADAPFTVSADGTLASATDRDQFRVDVPLLPGNLTVSITPRNGSTFDSRIALSSSESFLFSNGASSGGGGLLAFSAGSSLSQYVFPGPFYIRVSSGSGGGDYTVRVHFAPNLDLPYETDPIVSNQVGRNPQDIAPGDFNRDGVIDLAVANHDSGDLSVLLGVGDASFLPEVRYPVFSGDHPDRIVGVDFNHDGRPDLAALDTRAGSVDILLGLGDGTFQRTNILHLSLQTAQADPRLAALFTAAGTAALSSANAALLGVHGQTVNADFNGDGSLDTALLIADSNNPGVFLGVSVGATIDLNAKGLLQYTPLTDLIGGPAPISTVLATVLNFQGGVGVQQDITAPSRATPIVADLNGDGVPDVVEVNRAGAILFRRGIKGQPGVFAPPEMINGPQDLAREITLVGNDPLHPQIAAIAVGSNRVFVLSGQVDPATHDVTWTRTFNELTGDVFRPERIAAGDLNGDTRADLVVADGFQGSVAIYLNQGDGTFRRGRDVKAGLTLSDLTLSDPNHDGHADLIVTDEVSGDVSIFPNLRLPQGQVGFGDELRFRAGAPARGFGIDESVVSSSANMLTDTQLLPALTPALSQVLQNFGLSLPGPLTPSLVNQYLGLLGINVPLYPDSSLDSFTELFPPIYFTFSKLGTSAVTLADLDGTGVPDLAVLNRVANELVILRPKRGPDGKPTGSFLDPQQADILPTGNSPEAIVTGHFTADGKLDLAVLNTADHTIGVYTHDFSGRLALTFTVDAGTSPTGLSVADVNGDGIVDLAVGNTFGDLLVLLGQGDGTFQPPAFSGNRAQLAQAPGGNGQPEVVVTDQLHNKVTLQTGAATGPQFTTVAPLPAVTQKDFAPGAVQFAKLEGNQSPFPDAVVVASGSNAVLVYRFLRYDADGQPTFAAPVSYAAGTNPAGLTIAEVNGDGIPDLVVANQGSNDVSLLFGAIDATTGNWVATPGPRLNSGGVGPIATTVRDVNGDGIPDLVVTNSQSLTVLPGVGQGFFNDLNPQSIPLPGPAGGFSVNPSGIGVVPIGRQLVGFDLGNLAAGVHTVFTFPEAVNAAQVLADGTVAVALADGRVEELLPNGFSTVTFASLTGTPLNPSALDVLGREVLVTSAGEDQVFVFAAPGVPVVALAGEDQVFVFAAPGVPEVALPAPSPPAGPVAEATPPSGAPLTLVLTLVAAVVPADSPTPGSATDEAQTALAPGFQFVAAATPGRSSGEAEAEEPAGPPAQREATADVDEELRRLNLDLPTPDRDRDGPSSRLSPTVPGTWDAAVASLAGDEVLPSFPARSLTPPPDWSVAGSPTTAAFATQPPVARHPDAIGRAIPDAPAPSVVAVIESPAGTGDAATAAPAVVEETGSPAPAPSLSEQASDAVFVRPPRDDDRDLAFLMAVAVGGFILNPGTGAASATAAGGRDLRGRRRSGVGRGS